MPVGIFPPAPCMAYLWVAFHRAPGAQHDNTPAMAWNLRPIRLTASLLMLAISGFAAGGSINLQTDGRDAEARGNPVMLVLSAHGCPYCERLRQEILLPMERSGEYRDAVILREVLIDDLSPVTDFDGREIASSALAERYAVRVTPTIVLVDASGSPLAEPLVGINTVEFYGFYLDRAIAEARDRLRGVPAP